MTKTKGVNIMPEYEPTVFLFVNGAVAVTDEHGQQVPELQVNFVRMMIDRMVKAGYDPQKFTFMLPTGGGVMKVRQGDGNGDWIMERQ